MNTTKFSEILDTLKNLDGWLTSLGIRLNNDRIHRAVAVVNEAQEGWRRLRETEQITKIGNINDYYFGIVEALEFCDIFRAFEGENPKCIGPKLERALSGPLRPADESPKNSDGRNFMFELALAADLRLRGADVSVGEPDITLTLCSQRFLVECKRSFREESIRPNVRDAARQLKGHLDSESGAAGIIAISVSRVLNPGDKLFVVRPEKDREGLGDRVEKLMGEREEDWQKCGLHSRVTAVLFHMRTPGVLEDRDLLTTMSYVCVMPTGKEKERFGVLDKELPALLSY